MTCPACGAECPVANRFCGSCGAALAPLCPACRHPNPPTDRFCGACGTRLGSTAGPPLTTEHLPTAPPSSYTPTHLAEKIRAARGALQDERKQVTVLFADIAGSTEQIQDLEPEEAQQLLDGAVRVMMDAVHRYEGTVSRLTGDGLMALFGAPIAHEDHAVRAGYAALALQSGIRRYAEEARRRFGVRIEARVGLNSGEVIVRLISDDLHLDYTAMGQTVHLAARMEQLAREGTTLLSPATLVLVEGYVHVRSLGPVAVRGLAEPLEVFELLGASAARTRLQAAAARGLTRFVGRQAELDAVYQALERASTGHGQVVAMVGEPGVGKSRLVREVTHSHRLQGSPHDARSPGWLILESGSVSYGKATSYLPVIDLLRAYFRIEPLDDRRTVQEKVNGKVLTLDRALEPCLPALLALLDAAIDAIVPSAEGAMVGVIGTTSLPDPRSGAESGDGEQSGVMGASAAWAALDPAQRRRQLLDAVRRLLLRESQAQPLLLVFEDLHWIDSETQALLDGLVESLPAARILLLVNYRPEYDHLWGRKTYYLQLRIDALPPASAGELLDALLGEDPSVQPARPLLILRTDGNPFFLEECVRALVETGALIGERGAYRLTRELPAVRMPATVQAILAARIDRLPPDEKSLLQTAAVIGKDVPYALLLAVSGLAEDQLQRSLAHLHTAEFLYEASLFPDLEYTFKHALTHEVAYGSLLGGHRRSLHAGVVEAIERLYPDRLTDHVEKLAHHAVRGERWQRAATYCHQAGSRSIDRSAHQQAAEWLEQALAALARLPPNREAMEQAIDLRLELHGALDVLGRYRRMFEVLSEAEEMATSLDDLARLASVVALQSQVEMHAGTPDRALAAAQRAVTIADALGDARIQIFAYQHLGQAHWPAGHRRLTVASLQRCVELHDEPPRADRVGRPERVAVAARAFQALAMAELGDFAAAEAVGVVGLEIADELGRPLSQAAIRALYGLAHLHRGELDAAVSLLERGLQISEAAELQHWQTRISAMLSLAYARLGRLEEASTAADVATRTARSGQFLPTFQVLLPEAYAALGDLERAAGGAGDLLAEARRQDRCAEAGLLRLLGEIAARRDPPDREEAERRYHEALALALDLELRPLEARCRIGLGTLLSRTDRAAEAVAELTAAVDLLREMGMAYWLPAAEAALNDARASVPSTDPG